MHRSHTPPGRRLPRALARLVTALLAIATALVVPIVATTGSPAQAYVPASKSLRQPIPAGAPLVTEGPMDPVTIDVADQGVIVDVDVAVRIDHPFTGDLTFHIAHPDGTRIRLANRRGTGADFGDGPADCTGRLTVFDDEATSPISVGAAPFLSTFRPEETLGVFDTRPVAGAWTFDARDNAPLEWGFVACVELRFTLSTGNVVTVTTTDDVTDATDGLVSLREAIDIAAGDRGTSTIELSPGATYRLACGSGATEDENRSGDLDLHDQPNGILDIDGNGSTIVNTTACTDERIFDVSNIAVFRLHDVTLVGGRGRDSGGAVWARTAQSVFLGGVDVRGTTTLDAPACTTECEVGGAVTIGDTAFVTIVGSSFTDNQARHDICTAACRGVNAALGLTADDVSISTTTMTGNVADSGTCASACGVRGVALTASANTVTVQRTSITANRAIAGAACTSCSTGGAVYLDVGTGSTFRNSVISDNTIELIGAGKAWSGGIYRKGGTLLLSAVTLADNSGPLGPNLYLANTAALTLAGTTFSTPSGESGCDLGTAPLTATLSFESGTSCRLPDTGRNVVGGGDPELVPLAGADSVRIPSPTSPLIDHIPAASCPEEIDRLGARRPIGVACDIGAIEAPVPTPPDPDPTDPDPTDPGDPTAPLPIGASTLVVLPPGRIFDTRPAESAPGPKGRVPAGGQIDVQVSGVAGVPPTGVAAVVLNVTATDVAGAGFVTVWPAGGERPLASSLNVTAAGQTRANLVTVPVSADGKVSLFSQTGAHLLADISGYYVGVNAPQSAGRVVPLGPQRLFDTRESIGRIGRGGTIDILAIGAAGLPTSGVSAVVLNLTLTGAGGAGFVSAWPTGSPQPLASVLNAEVTGETAPNMVIVPLGVGGKVSFFASAGGDLLADVTGYVTDEAATISRSGLFIPLAPDRVFDTRPGEPAPGPKGRLGAGATIEVAVGGVGGVPADAAGVAMTVTAVDAGADGFVSAWPSGAERPLASVLNVVAGDTRPNSVLVRLGGGGVELFAQPDVDLLADVTGYYLR